MTDWEYKVLEDYFNTTFTYRKDSDIFITFGRVELKTEHLQRKKEGKWIEKTDPQINGSVKAILKKKKRWLKILLNTPGYRNQKPAVRSRKNRRLFFI